MLRTTFRRIASAVGGLLVVAVLLTLFLLEGKQNYKRGVEETTAQYQRELESGSAAPDLTPKSLAEAPGAYHRKIERLKHLSPPSRFTQVNRDLIHDLEIESGYVSQMARAKSRSAFDNAQKHYEQSGVSFTHTLTRAVHKAEGE
jgi:hypothetical protein